LKNKNFTLSHLYIIAVLLFLFLPVLIIIFFSFCNSSSLSFPLGGFTLKWYKEMFGNRLLINSIKNSLVVAIIVSTISGILGTVSAFALNKYKFRGSNALSMFYMIPIALPGLILGISILTLFNFIEITLSLITVIVSHIVFCIPFVLLIMNSRLENLDFTIEEAALDLGANPFQAFIKVTFPLIRSSLFGATLIAFALSFDEFVVTFFTIGAKSTIPIVIWGMMRLGVNPIINTVSSIVTVMSIVLIFISLRVLKVNLNI